MSIFDFLNGGDPKDRFARQYMKRLRREGWRDALTYDRAKFAIVLEGRTGKIYLRNTFQDWLTYPRHERDAALSLAVRLAFEERSEQSLEETAPSLLPMIRNRAHFEGLDLDPEWTSTDAAKRVAMKAFCGPLAVLLAIDRPASMTMVNEGQIRRWATTFDELLTLAVENLRARTTTQFERAPEGFFLSRYNDYYDASRLLLPHVFEALPLKGSPVAVALSRACVAVTGSEDTPALIELAHFIDEAMRDETRPIAFAPMILEDGTWRPFAPTTDSLTEVFNLSVKQRLWEYAGQTDVLQAHLESVGEDVFVSPLENVLEEGRIVTWTSWAEGVPTLWPRADVIGLRAENGAAIARRWEDVEAVCGPLVAAPGFYPTRYRAPTWPSGERWAKLQACAAVPWFENE